MIRAVSTPAGLSGISEAMLCTFQERRKWINAAKPSATELCAKYPHFLSYGGQMVSSDHKTMNSCCNFFY